MQWGPGTIHWDGHSQTWQCCGCCIAVRILIQGTQAVGPVNPSLGQSVSVSFMKGQAGALGAVFLWLLVWGTHSPPILVNTPGVSQERLSANHPALLSPHTSQMSPLSSLG